MRTTCMCKRSAGDERLTKCSLENTRHRDHARQLFIYKSQGLENWTNMTKGPV